MYELYANLWRAPEHTCALQTPAKDRRTELRFELLPKIDSLSPMKLKCLLTQTKKSALCAEEYIRIHNTNLYNTEL